MQTTTNPTCDTCFRIACKNCDWIASDKEAVLVQKEILTACPTCGWQPKKDSLVS